jgi:hypothetical protein
MYRIPISHTGSSPRITMLFFASLYAAVFFGGKRP